MRIEDHCHDLWKDKKQRTSTLPEIQCVIDNGIVHVNLQWYKKNIQTISIPQLKNITKYWEKVKVNKHVAHQFIDVFEEIEKQGLLKYIISYHGVYVARLVRGSTKTLSNHSKGLAIDLNAVQNKLGTMGALPGSYGSLHEVTPIFNQYGFMNGSVFKRCDPMHYQVEFLL